jgi:hypothetical protein
VLVLGLLAATLAAEAQQGGKVWRIGWLAFTPGPCPPGPFYEASSEGLLELGPGRFPALAEDLVAAGVDVIAAAAGNPATLAAKSVTTTIPIVIKIPQSLLQQAVQVIE